MAETVTMPKLGFDMAEGTLVRWVIAEGEPVTKGAVLAEIETDKATVEVESSYGGIVRRHLVEEGTVVPVGTPIAIIGGPDEKIEAGIPMVEEKAESVEAPAGGEEVKQDVEYTRAVKSPEEAAIEEGPLGVLASPLARRMALEQNINLAAVHGSGPGGRIVKKDIEAYLQQIQVTPARAPVPTPLPVVAPAALPIDRKPPLSPLPLTQPELLPSDQEVPLPRLRAIVGRRMTESKQQIPHIYVTHEYNMGMAMELRSQVNSLLPEGVKISVNDLIVKAVALSLRQVPSLNATLAGEKVVHHGQVNIGIAVAVEGGLLTVVCREADRKPLRQISIEAREMAERARSGKVRPADIEGSTFTLSNLGMFDVEEFLAIINPPEAAILAVGSVRDIPVIENGEIKPGKRMKATVSVDHRVSDGADAARFLQILASYLEQPLRLMV